MGSISIEFQVVADGILTDRWIALEGKQVRERTHFYRVVLGEILSRS